VDQKQAYYFLKSGIDEYAKKIVFLQYEIQPQFKKYGQEGYLKSIIDAKYNLTFLIESFFIKSPQLFHNYLEWIVILFIKRNLPLNIIGIFLECSKEIFIKEINFDISLKNELLDFIDDGIKFCKKIPEFEPSFIDGNNPFYSLLNEFKNSLFSGDRISANKIIKENIKKGMSLKDAFKYIFIPFQKEIGRLCHLNQITVSHEHFCTDASQWIMSGLYEFMFTSEKNGFKLVSACINGELHEMGIRIVTDYFEINGWDTYYLGANMPANDLILTLIDKKPDILALSCTMTYNIFQIKEIIEKIRSNSMIKNIKIMAGGYPFVIDGDLWEKVGADSYAVDFESALERALIMLKTE
jgi:MerR family transcriptional regulator, light-induced transcriptional regulator